MKKIAWSSALLSGLLPLAVILSLSVVTKNYLLLRDYISVLGVREFGYLFNLALIISGLLIIPFAIYIHRTIKKFFIDALFFLVIVSLIGIGYFPMSIEPWHLVFSIMFFFFVFILILSFGIKTKIGFFSETALVIGVLGLLGDVIHIILNFSPLVEAVQVFMITAWLIYSGIDVLRGEFGKL